MNLKQTPTRKHLRSHPRHALASVCALLLAATLGSATAASVTLWDTRAGATDATKPLTRADWKAVPGELTALEAEPVKAASDPGYWGREYSFQGDAVIENHLLLAVCSAASGSVSIYAKELPAQTANAATVPASTLGRKLVEILPLGALAVATPAANRFAVIRNAGDEVILEINYSGKTGAAAAWVSLGRTGTIELKPSNGLKGLRLLSPLDYGILPTFLGDDLIYSPAAYPAANAISVPAENMFVGLPPGGDQMLVLTWPKGRQQLQLALAGTDAQRRIESLDFQADGQSFYLTSLAAPGLWHREELKPIYLEKDVPLTWQQPFPAKWKTQLSESGVKTTYAFRQHKGTVWRGVPGSYEFPARFDGEAAILHFGKKVPPKGEALIYCLEPRDTPPSILTPVDILKATLGRAASEAILDPAGRKLRTHHRRGGDGVHRACTCGCTEAIEAVFKAREECAKKEFISEAIDDMIFFVQRHVERIGEYQKFADSLLKDIRAKSQATPDLKPYFENLEQLAQIIPQEIEVQKENMKSLDYVADLARQTMALTTKENPDNLKTYQALLKTWRGMGGAQDYVVAKCHTVARQLFQEAGYNCAELPKAVTAAEEIRAQCREILRHADGYEIWADY